MNKKVFLLAAVFFASMYSIAQHQNTAKKKSAHTAASKKKYPYKLCPVYLGSSNYQTATLSKHVFDSLMAQGLRAVDSGGQAAKVVEFRIYYKERNIYEDTLGRPYIDYEMLTDLSKSNKLNSYVAIDQRTKAGDTVILDDIIVQLPDSTKISGIGMKITLSK